MVGSTAVRGKSRLQAYLTLSTVPESESRPSSCAITRQLLRSRHVCFMIRQGVRLSISFAQMRSDHASSQRCPVNTPFFVHCCTVALLCSAPRPQLNVSHRISAYSPKSCSKRSCRPAWAGLHTARRGRQCAGGREGLGQTCQNWSALRSSRSKPGRRFCPNWSV